MFPYQDPTGTDSLKRQGALDSYRGKLHGRYDRSAQEPATKFVPIARLNALKPGAKTEMATVSWNAFPRKRAGLSPEQIDRDRLQFQEEYVEWMVQKANGKLSSITFTTEFATYFQTLADLGFAPLVAGIKDILPQANPTVQELLGIDHPPTPLVADGEVGPLTWAMLNQVLECPSPPQQPILSLGAQGEAVEWLQYRLIWLSLLNSKVDGDFGPKTQAAVKAAQQRYRGSGPLFIKNLAKNPWNNGTKGILCLTHPSNTLPFLFQLLSHCGVPRPQIRSTEVCDFPGVDCVSSRSSDPNVCTAVQNQVRLGNVVSLRDPVKIRILELQGIWRLNGAQIDINNPKTNQGIWLISRGQCRGMLRNLPGLTLDGVPITSGAQVAKKLQVGADVMIAAAADLLR